ncbi:MAG: MATE family efflux transporter [Candidatus Woesearchaeota archaeon]
MKNHRVEQFIRNPKKALWTLAWPIIVGMLVQVSYNIIDTAWVGRLGAESIAALAFSFPIFFVMIAVVNGVNIGTNSLISRLVGANKIARAKNAAVHAFIASTVISVIFTVLGLVFLRSLFVLFGASADVLPLGISYMRILLFGASFVFLSFTFSAIFSSQGDTKTPMKVQIVGLIINMVLDPIFIFGFGLGVAGAAVATVISFGIAFLLGLYYMFRKNHLLVQISFREFRFSKTILAEISKVGFPATVMQLMISFYVVLINRFMAHFGTQFVAAEGLVFRLESVATMVPMAISIAMLTLVGMFVGAKKYLSLKKFIWYGLRVNVIITSVMAVIFFAIPELLFRVFTSDATLLRLASNIMRINVLTFPMMALGFGIARIMQGMGQGLPGLVITLTRVFLVFVPLSYLFVYGLSYGYLSVVVAMVIAGAVSAAIGLLWLKKKLRDFESICKPKVC